MAHDPPRDAFLEVDPSAPPGSTARAPAATQMVGSGGAYLEASPHNPVAPEGSPGDAPRRKKVRAEDRHPAGSEAVSLALLASLPSDRPLMAALWPDVSPADLLRAPPPPEAFAARCEYAVRALDAVARRDAETRARAEVAQRSLQQSIARLVPASAPVGGARGAVDPRAIRDAALAQLEHAQTEDLLDAVRVLVGEGKVLYAADASRLDAAAEVRGIDPVRGREAVCARGYQVLATEAREWAPCEALPGAPTTMDAAAEALLRHPAQGAEAVRGGVVLAWLRANGAATEVIARARDVRQAAERQGAGGESLTVHTQAWALGRRDVVLGATWLRSPGDIAGAVRAGRVSLDDLARSAREGVLGAWLRLQGWVAAAGAADLVARGEPTGMKRLAWSLGEPLVLGDQGFTDTDGLARAAVASGPVREGLTAAYVSGDLLAWLESLPPALRDEHWIDRLRRAYAAPWGAAGDPLPLWWGVYAHARAVTLTLTAAGGHTVTLNSLDPLRTTAQVSALWDDLKRVYRSGELLAWLSRIAPDEPLQAYPRPPRDLDAELNALLWDLGHPGLVMEWGARDFPVASPADLVRAYQASWQQVESQVARGYVLDWLARFHGAHPVGGVPLRELLEGLRGEVGNAPSGYIALKVALLCGLQYLPLDPCVPGDQATCRGYVGTGAGAGTGGATASPDSWVPLRDHLAQGSALVWLALQPGVRPQLAQSLLQGAFRPGPHDAEHMQRMMAGVARAFGAPRPSPVLQSELDGAMGREPPGPGANVRVLPARRTSGRRAVATLALAGVAALAGAGLFAWRRDDANVPGPTPTDGTESLVRLEIRVHADRTDQGRAWSLDGSRPDLGAIVQTRDEPVRVGPCPHSYTCAATFDSVRLSSEVPFRLVVTSDHLLWRTRVGATWLRWQGGRHEELRGTLGAVHIDVTITRLTPAVAPLRVVTPTVPPTPAVPLPDTGVSDAGARHRHPPRHPPAQVAAPRLGTPYTAPTDPTF